MTHDSMCIATALVLSLGFQIIHSVYWPYKHPSSNRLQQLCLSLLNLFYIIGEYRL
jgi:hypothetical protein